MFRMSSLPPRGTCAAHAPPLDHLDTDSSSRRGHTSGSERWKDALTAHFQQLSTIKPRISSRFAYRDRLRKASRKGPTTIRASCPIHATLWGCERNARTWCRGSSWQGTAGKTFLLFTCYQYGTLIGEYFIICIKILQTFYFFIHMTLQLVLYNWLYNW